MHYYIECFKKYVDISGRARRKEYWLFCLINFLVAMGVGFVAGFLAAMLDAPILQLLYVIYVLASVLPSWAVSVRRLHDIGRSGWWCLVGLVPFVGPIVLFVFACLDSQPGTNQYGPNPKEGALN